VTVPKPAGVRTGDVLVAQITADGAPTVSAVPAGWTSVLPSSLAASSGARGFAYYRVVGNAASEPASWTWQLNSARKWGAGMTAFSGVDTSRPLDTTVSTVVDSSYGSSTVTVPGVSTTTAGAMLVGGVALDSGSTTVTPPGGWTEGFEAGGVQTAELAFRPAASVGATGNVSWSLSKATAFGGWLTALRPAAG
jgi:hypothetical protein